jgi:hypothetical protein
MDDHERERLERAHQLLGVGGLIVRSAGSRSCRATSIGSPLSTSFATSSQTSCTAERICASIVSIASSFRCSSPAMRYQTLVARS